MMSNIFISCPDVFTYRSMKTSKSMSNVTQAIDNKIYT